MAEIDRILSETVVDAVGSECPPFSAPPESPKRESMEDDMLEYAALRTKELGQEAPPADNVWLAAIRRRGAPEKGLEMITLKTTWEKISTTLAD
jgi:hypothetical protein